MKITKLESQKKNRNRLNMHVDGEFLMGLSTDAVVKFSLYKDLEIEKKIIDALLEYDTYTRLRDRVLNYINKGIKTEKRIRDYFRGVAYKKKGVWFSEDYLDTVLGYEDEIVMKLKDLGFIDDARYASLFAESRVFNKPRSKWVITSELKQKGVDGDVAKAALEKYDNMSILRTLYAKKFKNKPLDTADRKVVDFLRRKGFNWAQIQEFAKELENDKGK